MGIYVKLINVPVSERIYCDLNAWIQLEPRDNVQNMDSIVQKILMIVGTRKKSRKWRESFGCDVYQYLFEPFDQTTADWIATYMRIALEDPANGITADVVDVKTACTASSLYEQTYTCIISWRCPKLEATQSVTFAMRAQ
ncbi:baseplate protein [Erwinia phage vB_EamM_Y3]|uniref:Baseplate protein n=1 Tax=Erwinia phage vB_EamM_Y3 TaxID=1983553 RepID=A0A2H4IB37_9CAUD|nr:baseplate protein [Erwinia phage vB_EamM_Y3]ARW58754.1 baseplate protein [Erwinia phage vB_EamM_Y3]